MSAETLHRPAATAGGKNATAGTTAADKLRWSTLLVVLAGTFMTTLDFFIVNVAIPSTQEDLHAGPDALQWIVAGFALATAAGLITAGRLGDLYGRRTMYALGLGLFTAASAACGLAPTAGFLIAARVAQGAAGALMGPQVLAILTSAYEGAARVKAFVAYGLSMGLAAVFGQLIGGVLIQANVAGLGWRSCFLINIPVGLVALVLVPRVVPESRGLLKTRLDLVGTVLVSLALVATVLPLIQGRSQGWPLWTWTSFAVALVLFGVFGWYQGRLAGQDRAPLVDPALFRNRGFTIGIVAQTVFWMGQGSFFLIFALYLQQGRGLSALESGMLFTPMGVGYVATSIAGPKLAARLGRQTAPAGMVLMALGLAWMLVEVAEIGTGGSVLWLIPAMLLDSAGMGMAITTLTETAMGQVAPEHTGAASGVVGTVMQVGGAIGIAVIGIVFYGALGNGATAGAYPHAFEVGLEVLVGVELAAAALLQLLRKAR